MGLLLFVLLGGNLYQYQKGFEFCKAKDYKYKECKFHEKMVKANPKSIHYKK